MLKIIKWLVASGPRRLAQENERLGQENLELQHKLERAKGDLASVPRFEDIASWFKAESLPIKVQEQVVRNMAPFLKTKALEVLDQAFNSRNCAQAHGYGYAALDTRNNVMVMRFTVPEISTEVKMHMDMINYKRNET